MEQWRALEQGRKLVLEGQPGRRGGDRRMGEPAARQLQAPEEAEARLGGWLGGGHQALLQVHDPKGEDPGTALGNDQEARERDGRVGGPRHYGGEGATGGRPELHSHDQRVQGPAHRCVSFFEDSSAFLPGDDRSPE